VTITVCLQCGEFKRGAFTPCPKCGYTPEDDESLTKHLLVSDHYHNRATLEAISQRVKSGEEVEFDPESLRVAWVSKAQLDTQLKYIGRGCMLVFAVILALIIGAIGVFVFWRP